MWKKNAQAVIETSVILFLRKLSFQKPSWYPIWIIQFFSKINTNSIWKRPLRLFLENFWPLVLNFSVIGSGYIKIFRENESFQSLKDHVLKVFWGSQTWPFSACLFINMLFVYIVVLRFFFNTLTLTLYQTILLTAVPADTQTQWGSLQRFKDLWERMY